MSNLTTPVLSTKEVSSGIAKIQKIVDGAVKAFPKHTHKQIAQAIVTVYGDTIRQKRAEIEAALAEVTAGKRNKAGIGMKQKGVAKLESYKPILHAIAKLLEDLGKPQAVAVETAAIERLEDKFLKAA